MKSSDTGITKMKTALLSALILTGCAAQPQQMPSSPASYTQSPAVTPQIDMEDACLVALIRTNSFNKLALPMLKKCNAGNQEKCTAFLLFYGAAKDKMRPELLEQCFENRWIGLDNPQHKIFMREAPEFIRQSRIFTSRRGF